MKKLSLLIVLLVMLGSCVTSKKYNELNALSDKHLSDRKDVEEKLANITNERDECLRVKEKLVNDFNLIKSERNQLLTDKKQLESLVEEYKKLNDDLFSSKKSLLDEASSNQKILADKLALKEKELNAISVAQEVLDEKLQAREAQLVLLEEENQAQSNRIKELEDRLKEKDLALQNLKTNISDALKGFSSDEISVEEKNGNLYVSLSEKLLFSSGSFAIDIKGKDAISKLGQVLSNQTDFNIVVEGHTDNDPFNGSGVLIDNWDLSVKRATSVVRILTQNGGVLPENVSASGRGEFIPLNENSNPIEKAKNRRTEIVLKPNLDRIMNLLNN
ncbi:OmpA family protein [Chitinophagales bacterium]|nr:OmpA family protein [Chitinophagales bacterium]